MKIAKFHGATVSLFLAGDGGESGLDMYCENIGGTAHKCPYAMAEIMPMNEDARCARKQDGRCPVVAAQLDALKRAKAIIARRIKEIEDEAE